MASTVLPLPRGTEPVPVQIKKYSIHGFSEIHPRRDIVQWYESTEESDVKSWHLFLKALQIFQNIPVGEYLSYYQIAGIHGAPYVQWNEHPQPGDMPGNYCTHGSALFLPWHTPYHLLFEQELVKSAIKHAESFSDKYKEEYVALARKIRVPYWDFALKKDGHRLPAPIREPRCKIKLPQPGSDDPPQEIEQDNPLHSYEFKREDTLRRQRDFAVAHRDFRAATRTLRCPRRETGMQSHPDVADKQLGTLHEEHSRLPTNFTAGVYTLLMHVKDYGPFSNTGYLGRPPNSEEFYSLEAYHNSVHVFTGTDLTKGNPDISPRPGHMSDTASAAFDPIFWLLHGNIDRIYALWQAINHQAEFQGQTVEATRLPEVEKLEAQDTHASQLRPFYIRNKENPDAHNTVWLANMVQRAGDQVPSRFDYGYTYPEIPESMKNDPPEKIAAHVKAIVRKLYGPEDKTLHKPEHYPGEIPKDFDAIDFRREWNIIFKVKRSLISHNFTIFFFLGDPGQDPYHWSTHSLLLGSFSTFKGQGEYCINCATQEVAGAVMKGAIDITEAIYTRLPEIRSDANLDCEKEIAALLKKHLTWRVMNHETGQGVNLESILSADPQALKVLPTSFLEPFLKSKFDEKSLEEQYLKYGDKLVLTQQETYPDGDPKHRDSGWWGDDD